MLTISAFKYSKVIAAIETFEADMTHTLFSLFSALVPYALYGRQTHQNCKPKN
jgi:hypothetical protein